MTTVTEFFIDKSMRLIARYLAAGKLRTISNGIENLPTHGPALIVARHYHHLFDGLTLFAAVHRHFHIVVTMDWVENRRTKFFMQSINRMARWPMLLRTDALQPRGNTPRSLFSSTDITRYQRRALREAVELLVEGRILVVFPEGYPNVDPTYTRKSEPDQFLPFKPGFLNILRAAEARLGAMIPIIPAGLHYEPGKLWTGYLTFGKPLYRNKTLNREGLIECLEMEVRRLCALAVNEHPPMRLE
jgi:1-acyl-sn-glycerol-3-phosphate acyltransferase